MWMLIILSVAVLIIFLWQISNLVSVIFGSLYVKTDRDVIGHALKLAKVKKGDIFYDLGCGNGDVLIEVAKLGAKAVGYEISPYYYILSKLRTFFLRELYHFICSSMIEGIDVRFKNILNIDLRKADVVYCYLLPKFLEKLMPKFKKELKPSAKLISIGFPIKLNKSTYRARAEYVENHQIFIYTKKSAA